ncbi:MAG: tetratricopeptide repeat protein [Gemmatimonadota bacterium]|nr:MAG: tetratricopeptide repeat protein [Gemmatimonadota bacterium]
METRIEELEKRLEAEPENVDVMVELASLYGERNEIRKAVDLLEQILGIDPENTTAHYNLGVCYFKVLKSDLEVSEIWEDKADDEEFFELAIVAFQRALELDSEFVEAYNNLGTLYALRGWNEEAKEQWKRSLELNSNQPEIRENLANL